MNWSLFLCFEFLTTKIIKHLTIWLLQLQPDQERRADFWNISSLLSWNYSCILGFVHKKAINFLKLDQALSFMSKIVQILQREEQLRQTRRVQWRRREGLHRFLFCKSRAKERFFSFIIVHYFYNKSEDISRTIFN